MDLRSIVNQDMGAGQEINHDQSDDEYLPKQNSRCFLSDHLDRYEELQLHKVPGLFGQVNNEPVYNIARSRRFMDRLSRFPDSEFSYLVQTDGHSVDLVNDSSPTGNLSPYYTDPATESLSNRPPGNPEAHTICSPKPSQNFEPRTVPDESHYDFEIEENFPGFNGMSSANPIDLQPQNSWPIEPYDYAWPNTSPASVNHLNDDLGSITNVQEMDRAIFDVNDDKFYSSSFTFPPAPSATDLSLGRGSIDIETTPREHPLYQNAATRSDGLYHCPWEGQDPSCNHKPQKLKCNYDKFVDSHLKPYRCKIFACENARFSSTACLLRHEREAHRMHGHREAPYLCIFDGCERGVVGNGFPRHWNLSDHIMRVHIRSPSPSTGSAKPPEGSKNRKHKASETSSGKGYPFIISPNVKKPSAPVGSPSLNTESSLEDMPDLEYLHNPSQGLQEIAKATTAELKVIPQMGQSHNLSSPIIPTKLGVPHHDALSDDARIDLRQTTASNSISQSISSRNDSENQKDLPNIANMFIEIPRNEYVERAVPNFLDDTYGIKFPLSQDDVLPVDGLLSSFLDEYGVDTTIRGRIHHRSLPDQSHLKPTNLPDAPETSKQEYLIMQTSSLDTPKRYDSIRESDHSQKILDRDNLGHQKPVPPLTDSGYASLGRINCEEYKDEIDDDSKTINTDNEDLAIQANFKLKLIAEFAHEVYSGLKTNSDQAFDTQLITETLPDLLKTFAMKARQQAQSKLEQDTTVFVRKHRRKIALSFRTQGDEEVPGKDPSAVGIISLDEKMSMWDFKGPSDPNVGVEQPEDLAVLDDGEDDPEIPYLPEARRFLRESKAYQWLIGRIRSKLALAGEDDPVMHTVEREILKGLSSRREMTQETVVSYQAQFKVNWRPLDFLEDQQYEYGRSQEIGECITLTGSGSNTQALTCAEYMYQTWPTSGKETLKAFQAAVNHVEDGYHSDLLPDGTSLEISVSKTHVDVLASGTDYSLVEIGEQFAWLGSALRSSPDGRRMAYCVAQITTSRTPQLVTFNIDFSAEVLRVAEENQRQNGKCWHPLFRNPVVVKGFPILARSRGECGLEISLSMMAALGDASRATVFDERLVIKGFSTMFVPTKRVGNSVQWHFLYNEDGSRISYLTAEERCPNQVPLKFLDASCLGNQRNFLGWASSAELRAGTADIRYLDIDWTGADFASADCALSKVSISAGKITGGGASFVRGLKDVAPYLSRGGPYIQEIHFARNINVVLYDMTDRRGWLVDGASALLHLTRTQLSASPYCLSSLFRLEDFCYADPVLGVSAAQKALTDPRNREMLIFEDVEMFGESTMSMGSDSSTSDQTKAEIVKRLTKRWCYQDLVRQTYHILELIHDNQVKALTSPALAIQVSDREKLEGFGFMDIVSGQNEVLPRVVTLESSGRNWLDFTRSIRAITLLGRGFGDIIKPTVYAGEVCKSWASLPKDKDYLAVYVSTLREICNKYGDPYKKPPEIAKGFYLHKADKLYDKCSGNCSELDYCDRVQVLFPQSLGPDRYADPFEEPRGAVILGQSKTLCWIWPRFGAPSEGEISDQGTDIESLPRDSGIGSSISTLSPGDKSGISSSRMNLITNQEGQNACTKKQFGHRNKDSVSFCDLAEGLPTICTPSTSAFDQAKSKTSQEIIDCFIRSSKLSPTKLTSTEDLDEVPLRNQVLEPIYDLPQPASLDALMRDFGDSTCHLEDLALEVGKDKAFSIISQRRPKLEMYPREPANVDERGDSSPPCGLHAPLHMDGIESGYKKRMCFCISDCTCPTDNLLSKKRWKCKTTHSPFTGSLN